MMAIQQSISSNQISNETLCNPLEPDNDAQGVAQRCILLVQYDGSAFQGNQFQDNGPTVQKALEDAFRDLRINTRGRVSFAGRTDAGVHAKGQVAQIDLHPGALDNYPELAISLNHFLPESVSVSAVHITDDPQFHVTTSAQWRWYRYRLYEDNVRRVWRDANAAWIKPKSFGARPLNISAIQRALSALIGVHNFDAFGCTKKELYDPVCALIHASLFEDEQGYINIDLIGNRFIYKMVRSIVGTLIEIGHNTIDSDLNKLHSLDYIKDLMHSRDRSQAGVTAPSQGLTLQGVLYPPPWDFFKSDVYVKTMTLQIQELSRNEENVLRQAF